MIKTPSFAPNALARYYVAIVAVQAALFGSSSLGLAQLAVCGDPPPVANEALKGEIEEKIQGLSRFIGHASLADRIATSRQEILSKYPNRDSRSDAYIEYTLCLMIMSDQDTTSKQKVDTLAAIKNLFYRYGNAHINVQDSTSVIIGDGNTLSLPGDPTTPPMPNR